STTGALNGYASQIIAQSNTANAESSIVFTNSTAASTNNWSIGTNMGNTNLSIYSWSGGKTLCINQKGNVGIGTGGADGSTQLYLGNGGNNTFLMQFGGVLGNGQSALATPGLIMRPTSNLYMQGFQFTPLISPGAANTYSFGYSVRADGFRDTTGFGTLSTWANFYSDGGGTSSNGSGTGTTVTNAYSLFINKPTFATNNYCAYLSGNVGINTYSPSYSLDITGQERITTSDSTTQLIINSSAANKSSTIQFSNSVNNDPWSIYTEGGNPNNLFISNSTK
ncbi:MAG: hypothetical protein ACK56I_06130, partial [bacterium]